jgi:hypothetical protein
LKQVKKRNIEYNIFRSITIVNEGRHHAHMWCASKDDRIGGEEGLWLKPGEALAWTFHKTKSTQFWCTMDWFGRRYGWDVYVSNWEHNHKRDQRFGMMLFMIIVEIRGWTLSQILLCELRKSI